ncbi:MAG: hypothetical protein ACREBG_04740 [Pyrinomonadaceae bacterium]
MTQRNQQRDLKVGTGCGKLIEAPLASLGSQQQKIAAVLETFVNQHAER